jgi:hypothetical protein
MSLPTPLFNATIHHKRLPYMLQIMTRNKDCYVDFLQVLYYFFNRFTVVGSKLAKARLRTTTPDCYQSGDYTHFL